MIRFILKWLPLFLFMLLISGYFLQWRLSDLMAAFFAGLYLADWMENNKVHPILWMFPRPSKFSFQLEEIYKTYKELDSIDIDTETSVFFISYNKYLALSIYRYYNNIMYGVVFERSFFGRWHMNKSPSYPLMSEEDIAKALDVLLAGDYKQKRK